jgi:quinol monooxygenase YgiN
MAKGGTRIGGKPKGFKSPRTIDKLMARDALRQIVLQHMEQMTQAQIANAQGIKYLVARDPKTGKFERIGPEGIRDDAVIEVWEKDPSVQAFSDLMNRALDKPAEQEQQHEVKGTIVIRHELG